MSIISLNRMNGMTKTGRYSVTTRARLCEYLLFYSRQHDYTLLGCVIVYTILNIDTASWL